MGFGFDSYFDGFLFLFFVMDFCFLDLDGWILDSNWLDFEFQWGLG